MNKKIMIMALIIIAIISAAVITFVISNNQSFNVTVTDSEGYEISLDSVPERVISLIPAATETIYDLGKESTLVAVDTYSNYPEATNELTKLETSTNLNIESIIAMTPDVVFMSKMGQTIEQYNSLVNAGINVVIVDADSIEETYTAIEIIGDVLDADKKADEIVIEMKEEIEIVKEECKDLESISLYYEVSPLQYGLWTTGTGTFVSEMLEILNVNNVFNDIEGWKAVSEEQVIALNPEYIVTTSMDYEGFSAVGEIKQRENWKDITAIKNDNVYNINADIVSRPTKRLIEGMKELKKLIYGE